MFGEPQKVGFGELPQALVQDVLNQSLGLAGALQADLTKIRANFPELRKSIGRVRSASDLPVVPTPTTCGVDGSYIVEKLLSTDLAAFAGLAIEGLTPPSEMRFWPEPKHVARVFAAPHHEATSQILRGLMMSHELALASNAPHDVVMLDNSLKTFLIYLNNATSAFDSCSSNQLADAFRENVLAAVEAYTEVLSGARRDRMFIALPKYSTLRELAESAGIDTRYDDRTLASLVLNAGEFVGPFDVSRDDKLHLYLSAKLQAAVPGLKEKSERLPQLLNQSKVVYYKPRQYLPAFRIEMASAVGANDATLASAFKAIEFQSSVAGLFEPFPLYLADRMVSHLSVAFPSFLQAVTHEMASKHSGDVGEVYLTMHSYRSEGGQ